MESSVSQLLSPYLEKKERIEQTLILKKATCCFTDRRLFMVRRKQFGFKRYFVDVFYRDVSGTEFFRTFNSMFFLYGIFLLVTMLTQGVNVFLTVALAAATFIIVFLFPIHGIQLHHENTDTPRRLEILGTKGELQRVVSLLREYGVNV